MAQALTTPKIKTGMPQRLRMASRVLWRGRGYRTPTSRVLLDMRVVALGIVAIVPRCPWRGRLDNHWWRRRNDHWRVCRRSRERDHGHDHPWGGKGPRSPIAIPRRRGHRAQHEQRCQQQHHPSSRLRDSRDESYATHGDHLPPVPQGVTPQVLVLLKRAFHRYASGQTPPRTPLTPVSARAGGPSALLQLLVYPRKPDYCSRRLSPILRARMARHCCCCSGVSNLRMSCIMVIWAKRSCASLLAICCSLSFTLDKSGWSALNS